MREDLCQLVLLVLLAMEIGVHVRRRDPELRKIVVDWLLSNIYCSVSFILWKVSLWWRQVFSRIGLKSGVLVL